MLHISSTDKEVLDWIKSVLWCGSVDVHTKRKGQKEAWRYYLHAIDDVNEVLTQIFPYLKMNRKRKIVELLLIYCDEHKRRAHTTNVELEIYWGIRELNKRGE